MESTLFLRRITKSPKKVLVLRTDRIGDFVLSLPVFEVLSNRLGMTVDVLCRPAVLPLLDHNPHVRLAHSYNQEIEKHLLEKLNHDSFDALLVLVNDEVARRAIPQLSQIPIRIGPLSKPGMLRYYTHPAIQKRSRSVQSEALYNLDLTRAFGWDGQLPPKPQLYFNPAEVSDFAALLTQKLPTLDLTSGYIVVHPGMAGSALNWPLSHYGELLAHLAAKQQVVLTGASLAESETNQQLIEALPSDLKKGVFNGAQKFSLRELALLCRAAQCFVGPSTGPTHLAAAAGAPVVSFYPPIRVQSKTRWAPFMAEGTIFDPQVLCGEKYQCRGVECEHFDCMSLITAEQVYTAVLANQRWEAKP
ncbi:MAG: glycosyltransferase family 9 protein [bacterium]|nr:glycosyltransferase family 9 protein [bacterium]